ncbi:multidrug efflux SMR transporter [Myroides marinus]|jgi:small multidrug resistance pump|uniref:DMT family transporter n=1 Tax=Myroides marinus TaxID=703342 RepID=UPI000742092B|nr:multidrug efflux SMR transporter [Myroides marinus]MDR0194449.1 multidrug efflux SMR transporter [Myroides sp.]KUF40222.1 multidrug transporter [Myroides marinus]MDM1345922.1 multidrug efflux SMR transporter [Myroides marinus]MDM1350136.1 multidrug efflux SMR transporter [Myroides marinus]MDM1353105.1 multidrug efflux SMR transporter [Myroides marinus]
MKNIVFLLFAILLETIATTMLKASEGFTKPIPTAITLIGYAGAFYLLSLTLRTIPIGIAYALWSGIGIVLVTVAAYFLYKQKLDTPALIGISLIIIGVLVIQLFSKSQAH